MVLFLAVALHIPWGSTFQTDVVGQQFPPPMCQGSYLCNIIAIAAFLEMGQGLAASSSRTGTSLQTTTEQHCPRALLSPRISLCEVLSSSGGHKVEDICISGQVLGWG